MTYPTIEVEVAFASDPLDTTPTYTDITEQVFAVETSVGRSVQFDAFAPGTATLTLDNTDRLFDPLHSTGTHYGDLLPNKRVRVQATYDGTTYELFTGHVDGWPQSYSEPFVSTSTVTASDAFKLLSRTPLPVDRYAPEILADTPRLWYRLGETSGKQLLDSSGNGRHALGQIDISNVTADGLMLCSTDGGVALDSAQWDARIPKEHLAFDYDPCTIEFWFMADKPPQGGYYGSICASVETGLFAEIYVHSDVTSPGYEGCVQFAMGQYGSGTIRTVMGSFVCDGVPHHIACTRSGSTLKVYVDGVDVSRYAFSSGSFTATVSAPLDLNVNYASGTYDKWDGAQGPSLDEFAIYDAVLSQARIQAHHQAGALLWNGDRAGERVINVLDSVSWPSAFYDVDTGQTILGPAAWDKGTKVLEYLRLVEASEQGQLFCDHANGGVVRFRSRATVLNDARSLTNQAIFSDNDGDAGTVVRYETLDASYDESELVNTVDVEWVGGTVTASDQTSIDAIGEMGRTITTIMTSKADAEALASWVLNHSKDAFLRIEAITIHPNAQSGDSADRAWEAALGLQIGDRVLVVRTPQNVGVAIDQAVLIEGISHTFDSGQGQWATTFQCGPSESSDYWILGGSELGTGTRLAF